MCYLGNGGDIRNHLTEVIVWVCEWDVFAVCSKLCLCVCKVAGVREGDFSHVAGA